MAFVGVQFVLTLIMISFLNKLSSKFSIAKWILTKGLFRYLAPSDDTLREIAGVSRSSSDRSKKNKRDKDKENRDDSKFQVPRNMSLTLESDALNQFDVLQLPYYAEFQWLIDFSSCALLVYIFTEIYSFLVPSMNNNEFNLSLIWCSLVVAFSLKLLFSITSLYFRGGDEAIGERSMCIMSGCFFFLFAMVVLITNENLLEFGLIDAYKSFNSSAYQVLASQGLAETAYGPTSILMLKFWLAIWCAIIGAFFTFPGLRFAKMHIDALTYAQGNHISQLLLNMSFISPLFVIMMWVKPIARDYLTVRKWSYRGNIMTDESFETTRIILIMLIISLRMSLIRTYLQSYLNIAPQKLHVLNKEAGRITNKDLQKLIASVFFYLCVVALQYVTPLLICLFMSLLMKTLSDYSWVSHIWTSSSPMSSPSMPLPLNATNEFSLQLLKSVFTPIVFKGVLGFMVWWISFVWFSTCTIGFVYHSYFA